MQKSFLFSAALFLLLSSAALAQKPSCGTDQYNIQRFGNPNFFQDRLNQEANQPAPSAKTNGYTGTGSGTKFLIPVVVHVFYNNPVDSITIEQVKSQFAASFRDIRRKPWSLGWGGEGVSGDGEIEFALATKDPSGNPHSGVNYFKNGTLSDLNQNTENNAIKSAAGWPRNKYLNIYLVNRITSSGQFTLLAGYAEFPTTSPSSTDGIVMINESWGTIGTAGGGTPYGRVFTHEAGHWVNLYHTFQGSCGTNCATTGDGVCDTPPTKDPNSSVTTTRLNTCTNDVPDVLDNQRNYMDYSNDAVHNLWTLGQTKRSQAAMSNVAFVQRYPLWQESNLEITGTGKWGPPTADFASLRRVVCAGTNVQLTDYSLNLPTRYKWVIPGASFVTSDTIANPIVKFITPGSYDVTLIVGNLNDAGITDTLTVFNYFRVTDTVYQVPFSEGFQASAQIPADWTVEDLDSGKDSYKVGFEVSTRFIPPFIGGFGRSTRSAFMQNFVYADQYQVDRLTSPAFNLSDRANASMSFAVAYRHMLYPVTGTEVLQAITLTDTLRVLVSTNCGETWQKVYQKGGLQLNTAGGIPTADVEFKPDTNQWRRDTIDLSPYAGASRVMIRFEAKNGYGNNLYLDDIQVDTAAYVTNPTATEPNVPAVQASIVPNPSQGESTLRLTLRNQADMLLTIVDIQGREVLSKHLENLSAGNHDIPLSLVGQPSGVYLVSLKGNGIYQSQRLVVQR
jgi:PKD repeat protein